MQTDFASQGKVLLFGQSAGAVDVFTVATLPQAPSLFNAAVMESGGGRDAPLKTNANKIGEAYAKLLNCSAADVSDRSLPFVVCKKTLADKK